MGYGVVCISHHDGAAGAEASRIVAQTLSFRLIDEDLVAREASEPGVQPDVVADVEQRKSILSKLLEGLGPAGMAATGMVLPEEAAYGLHSSGDLRGLIKSAIEETAAAGRVVIVAHAASLALAGRADVLRVLITAPPEARRRRVAASLQLDDHESARTVKRGDAARADYIKRFYGIDSEQPIHYDLVINTERLTPDEAARLIVAAATGS